MERYGEIWGDVGRYGEQEGALEELVGLGLGLGLGLGIRLKETLLRMLSHPNPIPHLVAAE